MLSIEPVFHWVTVVLYALSAILFLTGAVFRRETFSRYALLCAGAGFICHTAALGIRWYETGHGPYMKKYEAYSSYTWVAVCMYLITQYCHTFLKLAGVVVMPVSFLVVGLGVMSSSEAVELPRTFNTIWLVVHILFAQIAFGAVLLGTASGIILMIKVNAEERGKPLSRLQRTPDITVLDDLSYRFIGLGFVTMGIMIASGSIWAEYAWGSYWSWDPVETWSLISWIIYGLYLHLRKMHGLKGKGAAWFSIVAFVVLLNTLLGIGFLQESQHAPYLN